MNASSMVELLPVERVGQLYAEGMTRYGGAASPPKDGCVEGAVQHAALGAEYRSEHDEPDPFIFAIYLFYYLAMDHCYMDGNKRLAWSALSEVLACFDLRIEASDDEAEAFVVDVISEHRDHEWIAEWARPRLAEVVPLLEASGSVQA